MNGINEYNRITRVEQNTAKINEVLRRNSGGASFETILKEQLNKNESLQFSKHAKERVNQRGIEITDALLKDLNSAVSKARDKGAKDVVIFDAKNAFIVNIPNNMVITTMAGSELKENVFTNIDSAVII
ncbi:TIGR02530 family flagellar biosynthesis protein [Anaerovorax sp. IOR16]|uniref:TIGR02530 family flagellar biosynthesis protein n=1 Tax=Anaerovorax sp. IOR16 TaxID=2773458 RepID=UPI0019D2D5F0|nr:TIGR02530 family flagellar biosynthesis protein [Anaerovorax sp. IOR16]